MMKKSIYVSPKVEIHNVTVESYLLTDSEDGKATFGLSKGHDSFFDTWDTPDEEEEQPAFTNKSLWED